jgi:hypothetical protein
LGGPYLGEPAAAFGPDGLSVDAKNLVRNAFDGFKDKTMRDYHVHFFGNSKPDVYKYCPDLDNLPKRCQPSSNVNELVKRQKFWARPFIQGVYLDAVDVKDENKMDDQYLERLVNLVSFYGPPKVPGGVDNRSHYKTEFFLMALDGTYDERGVRDEDTLNYVSNRYIVKLVDCLNKKVKNSKKCGGFFKNKFVTVGSINPMRASGRVDCNGNVVMVMRNHADWMDEITFLKRNHVKWIKWRPPTMEFDPSSDMLNEFYAELVKTGPCPETDTCEKDHSIGIMTHTGISTAIKVSDKINEYASPMKMENAIEIGVKVVALHIGRAGPNKNSKKYSDEFFTLAEKYVGREDEGKHLYGEISAIP